MITATALATAAASCNASLCLPQVVGSGNTRSKSLGVRFTLRKRLTRPNDEETVSRFSYNSGFLSGLFADVATTNVLSEFQLPETHPATSKMTVAAPSHLVEENRPLKKSRLSLTSYCPRSISKDLVFLSSGLESPKGINEILSFQKGENPSNKDPESSVFSAETLRTEDSLAFQLSLLGGNDSESRDAISSKDVAVLAFPNLPATISDSSCYAGLTHDCTARHEPASEPDSTSSCDSNSHESSFGWFVDLDNQHEDVLPPSKTTLSNDFSTEDLAFQAPTAPKRSVDDTDVEWAQAADTVDSVLGDLF